jgi:hypothetical protein
MVSSGGSEDNEPEGVDFRGDSVLWFDRVALSARPDEIEEAEECWEVEGRGWLERFALDDRLVVSIFDDSRM